MKLFLMNRTFQLTIWQLEVQKGAVAQVMSSQVRGVEEQKAGEGDVGEGRSARHITSWRAHTCDNCPFLKVTTLIHCPHESYIK